MKFMEEIFKQAQYINPDGSIETFENYEVSNLGRVKSCANDKSRKEKIRESQTTGKLGHQYVCLYKNNKTYLRSVHRLILSTFNPESHFKNAVVDHIDSNPRNNRLDNLRWVTQKENTNTDHARQAMSEAKKGKRRSEETKKKISEAKKDKYKGSKHPLARSCVYDNKMFGSYIEAYWYAQAQGYTKCYDTFRNMIKNEYKYIKVYQKC